MKILALLVVALVLAPPLRADGEFASHRGWLHLNGYSHHFAAADARGHLFGVGFTKYRRLFGRILPAWEGDAFQDSGGKLSAYVGHSWTVPTMLLSVGVTGAVMYHRNFKANNSLGLLPVALPFVETRLGRIKARAYYVPAVRRASDEQIAVQLMIPLWR